MTEQDKVIAEAREQIEKRKAEIDESEATWAQMLLAELLDDKDLNLTEDYLILAEAHEDHCHAVLVSKVDMEMLLNIRESIANGDLPPPPSLPPDVGAIAVFCSGAMRQDREDKTSPPGAYETDLTLYGVHLVHRDGTAEMAWKIPLVGDEFFGADEDILNGENSPAIPGLIDALRVFAEASQ